MPHHPRYRDAANLFSDSGGHVMGDARLMFRTSRKSAPRPQPRTCELGIAIAELAAGNEHIDAYQDATTTRRTGLEDPTKTVLQDRGGGKMEGHESLRPGPERPLGGHRDPRAQAASQAEWRSPPRARSGYPRRHRRRTVDWLSVAVAANGAGLRQHPPTDAGLEDEDDAGKGGAVRHVGRPPLGLAGSLGSSGSIASQRSSRTSGVFMIGKHRITWRSFATRSQAFTNQRADSIEP